MRRNKPIYLLVMVVTLSAAIESWGQQPTPGQRPGNVPMPDPRSDSQQRQKDQPAPYYDYPYASETTASRTLSIDEAVRLALDNAASLRQAQFDELSAAEDVKQARAAMLPQFSIPLSYWGTTPSTVRQSGDPLTFSFVSASAINESIGMFNTTGEIDIAGRLRAGLGRSRALLAAAHAGTMAARRNLVLGTIDAFYGLVLARERRRLADEALALAESFLADLNEQTRLGPVEETDILRARSAAYSRRDELAQARLAESVAMSQLRVLTGVDYDTYITVVRLTENVPKASDVHNYQDELVLSRPELVQIDAQQRAAFEDARVARRERRPQLTYSLNIGFDAADFKPLKRYSGGAALITLNIPVFDFGASKSRETQALLHARAFEAQREVAVRGLKQEFYAARAGALSAVDRTSDASQAAAAAQQNVRLMFDRYKLKKATLLEVIDAQSNYASTRLQYYQAIADYYAARARLETDPAQMFGKPGKAATQPETEIVARCMLSVDQAPALGGLRLGMSPEQVKQVVPTITISAPNELGVANAELKTEAISRMSSFSFFEGVESIALEFVDGRLAFVRVTYPSTSKWTGKEQFLSEMAPKFQLHGDWKPFYDWENKDVHDTDDLRDLGLECGGFRLSLGIGIEELRGDQSPHYELDDLKASRIVKARELQRSKQEKPKP